MIGAPDNDAAMERAKQFSLKGIAERIVCPTLVMHGENDRIVPVEEARTLYDNRPSLKEVEMELRAQIEELGMAAFLEVHNVSEVETAIELGFDLVGVNNRDLRDFQTRLVNSETLIPILREGLPRAVVVSESAIENNDDVERVKTAGARSVLVGTTFCAAPDIEAKVREVMAW